MKKTYFLKKAINLLNINIIWKIHMGSRIRNFILESNKKVIMKINLVLFILFLSCNQNGRKAIVNDESLVIYDTIKYTEPIVNKRCSEKSYGYFSKYGYCISNFYEDVQSVFIDINNDAL